MRLTRQDDERSGFLRLPLTSMIDVFFLLLVYFVVQARFTANESQLASQIHQQREGAAAQSDLQPQIIEVRLSAEGRVEFNLGERTFGSRGSLTAALLRLPPDAPVFVRAHPDVPWSGPVAAQQACKDAGIRNVSYVPTGN